VTAARVQVSGQYCGTQAELCSRLGGEIAPPSDVRSPHRTGRRMSLTLQTTILYRLQIGEVVSTIPS
jgi:hypothetical protein